MVLAGTLLLAAQAHAQQKTVSGKVTNEQGQAMPGVQVVLKGTGIGTLTNVDGNYSIRGMRTL